MGVHGNTWKKRRWCQHGLEVPLRRTSLHICFPGRLSECGSLKAFHGLVKNMCDFDARHCEAALRALDRLVHSRTRAGEAHLGGTRQIGRVTTMGQGKFGFIKVQDGEQNVYFHFAAKGNERGDGLRSGDAVAFNLVYTQDRRPQGFGVRPASTGDAMGKEEHACVGRLLARAGEVAGEFESTGLTQTLVYAGKVGVVFPPEVREALGARAVHILGSFSKDERELLAQSISRGAMQGGGGQLERAIRDHDRAPRDAQRGGWQPPQGAAESDRTSKRPRNDRAGLDERGKAVVRHADNLSSAELTSELSRCTSLGVLKRLVAKHLLTMEGTHTTAAFRAFEHLVTRRGGVLLDSDKKTVTLLLERVGAIVGETSLCDFCTTIRLLSVLGEQPQPAVLPAILARAMTLAGEFSWFEAEDLLKAFARWNVVLSVELGEALQRRVKRLPAKEGEGTRPEGSGRGLSGVEGPVVKRESSVGKDGSGGQAGTAVADEGPKEKKKRKKRDREVRRNLSRVDPVRRTNEIAWCASKGTFRDLQKLDIKSFNPVHVVRTNLLPTLLQSLCALPPAPCCLHLGSSALFQLS